MYSFIAVITIPLFLLNISMFFIFLTIKKSKSRRTKIFLAKFSKKLMKYHMYIGLIGAAIITIHAVYMLLITMEKNYFWHIKNILGEISYLLLLIVLFAGYLRRLRASGIRRKFHLYMAMLFALNFITHIIL